MEGRSEALLKGARYGSDEEGTEWVMSAETDRARAEEQVEFAAR